ncbi:MAG: aspartate dehydrogenase [Candidatus Omnitrophica bacterium]|nr:aspartate dehydrogenase [Candidatus Omnitrophota bacterium]
MLRIGIVGCGAIGSQLAREIQRRFARTARLIGVHDIHIEKARKLGSSLHPRVPALGAGEIVRRSSLILEAASPGAVEQFLPETVRRRKSTLILSSGGLLTQGRWLRRAAAQGVPVYVPSGAILGLDGIRAAAVGRLKSVTLTTRKPPRAFRGAPGLARRKIRPEQIRAPRVLFQGSAGRAAALFPQNINVAATLALAGIGPKRTRVRIIADPRARANIHEIEATGDFGKLFIRAQNRASARNPKTSQLAIQSAVVLLGQILRPVRIGS